MNALQCTLVVLPFLGLLAGCSGGDSTEPPPEAEGALAGSEDADRLATFGLASGAIATGEAAVALRQSLLDRGGKRAFSDDKTVVAGFIGRELAGFGRDDSRFFGITCQAAGTDVPGAGRLAVDTCSLSAVVEMAAQDGRKIGKLDTREKESAEYVAHLSGVLAAEIAKATWSSASGVSCVAGAHATCTVRVQKGDLGSFEPALTGPLRAMKLPEISKLVRAFFPESP